jgi:hypothetical protein
MAQTAFPIGSYARKTLIRVERDIDVLAPLSYSAYKHTVYGDDSRELLYMVRNALNERYGTTKVSSQQVAVKLDFASITVDVVPCYTRSGGGYLMADGYRGWKPTNPPFHAELMQRANVNHGLRLKPLVKLLKYWNFVNGKHLSSFHVELMVERMWRGTNITNMVYSTLVSKSIKAMPGWLRAPFPDPWPDGKEAVDSYLSTEDRRVAINLLEQDAIASAAAEQYRIEGKTATAFERWDVVYRHQFPAYG